MRAIKLAIVFSMVLSGAALPASGQRLLDRSGLDAVPPNTLEDFSGYPGFDGRTEVPGNTLNASTPGFEGIVGTNVQFMATQNDPQLDPTLLFDKESTGFGLPSAALQAEGGVLTIDFIAPVTNAGFDMFNFFPQNFTDVKISVFTTDANEHMFDANAPESGNGSSAPADFEFFGYRAAQFVGIDKIELRGVENANSPFISNLSYGGTPDTRPPGGTVPEPASFAVFGLGTMLVVVGGARRRRKD